MNLDLKDKRILYALEQDARQSLSSIAKHVGLSKQLVHYKMRKLEEHGIIKAYTAIIDGSRLGFYVYRIYLKFAHINTAQDKEEMYAYLSSFDESIIVNSIEGPWDVGIVIAVKDVYDYYQVWDQIMKRRDRIAHSQVAIYSPISHFTRTLLAPEKNKQPSEIMIIGGKEQAQYDELDIQLLQTLAKNVRRPSTEIAQDIKLSAPTVVKRIRHLEQAGIIQGYRPLIDWQSLGYSYYKIDLHLSSHARNSELFSFCHLHPNIIQVNQTIGGSDFEFEVYAQSNQEFKTIMESMQEKFSKIIINYDYFIVVKPYKETFMAF